MRLSKERLKEIIRQEIVNSELNEGTSQTIDTSDGVQVDKGLDQATARVAAFTRALQKINSPTELSDLLESVIAKWIEVSNIDGDDALRMVKTATLNAIRQMSNPQKKQ